jgi:hypothetical protein
LRRPILISPAPKSGRFVIEIDDVENLPKPKARMQALLQRYLHVSDQGAIDRRIAIVARRKHAAGEEWWVEEYRIWIELEGQGGRRRAQAHGRRFVHGGHTSQAPGGRLSRAASAPKSRAASAANGARSAKSAEARAEVVAQRLRKLNERIIEAGKEAGETTLSSYEKALKAIATTLERGPGSSDVDWISHLATTQAKFIRDVTAAWTSAARDVLK